MPVVTGPNLDFLAARLHGRHGRMAEGDRLDALARLRSLPELARAVAPGAEVTTARELQRRLVRDLELEVDGFRPFLAGPGAALVQWLLARTPVELLKASFRERLAADADELPEGPLRASLEGALTRFREHPRPFFFEAALDRDWLAGLLARVARLSRADRDAVTPMARQEADLFHLRLVARGRAQGPQR